MAWYVWAEIRDRGIAHTYWGFVNDEPALNDTTADKWARVDILNVLLSED